MNISWHTMGWILSIVSILLWIATFLWLSSKRREKGSSASGKEKYSNDFTSENEVVQDSIIYFASSLFRQNTVEDILWDIALNCVDKLGFVDCVIYLFDEDKQMLIQMAAHGPKNDQDEAIVEPIEIAPGFGIVGSAFKSGKMELIEDVTDDPRYILDDAQRMSELAIPIITPSGKVVGVIDSEHPEKGFFNRIHIKVLSAIATICAIKVVKAQADQELLIAKERAEEATKIKSQFLSTMSHEIRNPLNAVIGMSHLLMQGNPSPEQLEHLHPLHHSSKHLLSLVNDILDYSKLESGKVVLKETEFDLESVCKDLHQNFAYEASRKELDLKFKSAKLNYHLKGDVVRLNQVLNNLIGNAIKFTEQGSVYISYDVKEENDDICEVFFRVIDTGIGIKEEDKTKIFSQFEQSKSGSTREYEGTGLGLSISKKLIELQGGDIGVNSEPEVGSEFWFSLRFKKGKAIGQDKLAQADKPQLGRQALAGMKVLLVEDHIINQKIVAKLLSKWDIELVIAENGDKALDIILNQPEFDLVLMDLHMPVIGGIETTRLIRSQEEQYYHSVPIVALFADVSSSIQEETRSIGMNDFLSKPFDPAQLFAMLKKFYQAA